MAKSPRKEPYPFLPILPRLGRGGMVQRVQDAIREAIVHLELPPGAFLDKAALCARLDVSRFPVSEALGRLADEGLVEVLPQRGTRVARIRPDDVRQLMFIRRALESEVAAQLALRADADLMAILDRNLAEQQAAMAAGDARRFHTLDFGFHDLLLDALGYERVRAAVDVSRASLDRVRRMLGSPRRFADTFAEHRAIVAALRRRDPGAARAAMQVHLDVVMTELDEFAAANPDVFEPDGGSAPPQAKPRRTAAAIKPTGATLRSRAARKKT